jgi:hypothetical protein
MKARKRVLLFICTILVLLSGTVSATDRTAKNPKLARITTNNLTPVRVNEDSSYTVNFELVMNYAVICQMLNYNPVEELKGVYPGIRFIDLPKFRNRMMIINEAGLDENEQGIQTIVFAGSARLSNFLVDLDLLPVKSEELNCRIHRGFLKSVIEVDSIVTQLLDKKRKIRLAGSSHGGALAIIYAMFLKNQGFDIDLIITFGQPRVTDEKGRNMWNNLPLIRVVNRTDILPDFPPHNPFGYAHFGRMIFLYDDYNFSIYDEMVVAKIRPETKVANLIFKFINKDISIPNHFINLVAARLETYVERPPIYIPFNLGILPEDAKKRKS